jgi:4-amino-4-deoxy-L-arabinose transferase-like glycosyltransferase
MSSLVHLKQHRAFLIVLAFAAVLFLSDIWIYKEFVRAESYFGLGARLMVESGDWLMPHAPDELPLNKPPLTYWLIGASYKLLGANYGSARLPSVLAALLVLAIVYALGLRLSGKRAALISVAILASSYLFLSFARMAMSDMLLTLCITASLACFISTVDEQGDRSGVLIWLGYVALALGVLAKGPVAIALVTVPIGMELMFRRDRAGLRSLRLVPGVTLFLLIAAPYFIFVYARAGVEPLRSFFFGENLQRFTGQIYGASGRPIWYEFVAFFSDFAPWSLLVFVALWFDWRGRIETTSKTRRVLYLWLGCTIVLFSLSSFKLDYYLLPAMPATALIIAPVFASAEALPAFMRRIVNTLLILIALGIVLIASLSLKAAALLSVLSSLRFLPAAFSVVGLGVVIACLARRKSWQAALALTATSCATMLSMQLVLLPSFVRYLPAAQLAASTPAGKVVYTSWVASDWANCVAFNLPQPHRVERLIGDTNNQRLQLTLKNDSNSIAIIRESEYANLLMQDSALKILAQAETFGHGGLSLKMIRDPRRERLFLVGHDH